LGNPQDDLWTWQVDNNTFFWGENLPKGNTNSFFQQKNPSLKKKKKNKQVTKFRLFFLICFRGKKIKPTSS
jgi:hypothetical protein